MTQQLSPFYKGWELYEQHLVRAIAQLSPEHLAFRAAPHTWTVGRTAAHIVAARVWWFSTRAEEGADLATEEQWNALEHWDGASAPARSASELVMGLELTWQMIESALACWTPADLEHVFPARLDDRIARSRQWIIWHVMEHDLFHGGELSSILGAHGLVGIVLE